MKNNICVYSCMTGEYDKVKELKNKESGIDYYFFTNNKKIKSNTWQVVYVEDKKLSNVLLARKIKILGNEIVNKYDVAVWMDAAVEFKKNIKDFIDEFLDKKNDIVCFKHGERSSILEEMDACLRFRKENIDKINTLKEFYNMEKYSYDNGLVESTVFIKKPKNPKVIDTMNLWFYMVSNYTKRDQLSFNYVINKTRPNIKWINEKVFDNNWFKWHEHSDTKIDNKCMIYFGDINKYDYSNQYEYEYEIKDNIYKINTKVKRNCQEIYIEISNVSFLKYKIINNGDCDITYHNTVEYLGSKYFFKKPNFIILNGVFNKNSVINIDVLFEELEDYEKNEIINMLIHERELFKKKNYINENSYNKIKKELNNVLNSTSWKITKPLRSIKSIFRK